MRALGILTRLAQSRRLRLWLMVFAMIGLIGNQSTTVRMPDLTSQREASGLALLRMLHTSQQLFATSCGNGGYARTIDKLAAPPPGASDGFFDEALLVKVGRYYAITLTASETPGPIDCFGEPTARDFSATAVPMASGESGRHSLRLTSEGAIRIK